MKDLPHHIKKLNRRVIRSARREEVEETLPDIPAWPDSKAERRKKEKREMKAAREAHIPSNKSPEERNREMKNGRVPVFAWDNKGKVKHTRATKKKTPKI
jgi:hypothetical protein